MCVNKVAISTKLKELLLLTFVFKYLVGIFPRQT
jgi:hypothetical protein